MDRYTQLMFAWEFVPWWVKVGQYIMFLSYITVAFLKTNYIKIMKLKICSPFVFHIDQSKFQNVLAHALVGHSHESSAAYNKVCFVVVIEISQNHSGSSAAT